MHSVSGIKGHQPEAPLMIASLFLQSLEVLNYCKVKQSPQCWKTVGTFKKKSWLQSLEMVSFHSFKGGVYVGLESKSERKIVTGNAGNVGTNF